MNKRWIKKGLIISQTLLFRWLMMRAGGFLKYPTRILALVNRTIERLKKYGSAGEFTEDVVQNVKCLCRLVLNYANGNYRNISKTTIAKIVASLLYFVSPIDLVPDTIPLLGLLDDLSLLAWLISTVGDELEAFKKWEEGRLPEIKGNGIE